ncbi:precorrin-6y C5,15-methyltransferase (decarboxylating) subunit CbiE [Kribbella sandramycini]|uniref:Precorrin-6Y C5,15-methyltransferase (Decarboxylating) n=1 Tax=Kribbella sandramycini TaxID=60450 RepID=A0A7Y4L5H8_9ACTN|nr:precorrin-6y C5,15-methyltransferase (decarboxylating) subunit CbiE [Kribbella sandramycini]MBB6571030.1 precorrin-6Y C5,15-methyltransferase (decarboxylating) [Kribbella sandramycini]NOL43561.1 precorrin-6y C5,15-methyltransferase (decarboxylating) subunit CbiE [Kribbella sandramycini]
MAAEVTVVGIGADGWQGLSPAAQEAIGAAEVLLGSSRQLSLVPEGTAERRAWPSPLSEALPGLLNEYAGRRLCVLASGDPTFHGIGTTLTRLLGASAVRVIPHPSSVSLACARLGWPQDQVQVVSLVGHPTERVHPHVQPGRRLVVLSWGAQTPAEVAELLVARGYGASAFTVLEQLGGPDERVTSTTADSWSGEVDALNVIGVLCQGSQVLSTVPGLPDDAYESDGQLTKREVRAVTLSRLAPVPGQLLWDVGGGAGSIAIEWSRHHPSCRAIAVERDAERSDRLQRNVAALGASVTTVLGAAPEALTGLEEPDAVFVGGGATAPGMIETCWNALRPGGRLVVNGVTLETEVLIAEWYQKLGGDLVRLDVQRASAVGGMTGWRPAMPVTIWSVTK